MADRNPPKERMCHKTGFAKSCRDLVVSEQCWLWDYLDGHDPRTGEAITRRWNCIDNHMYLLALQNGLQQDRMIATTDKVANEVKTHRDESVAIGAMAVQRARQAVQDVLGDAVSQLSLPILANGHSPLAIGKG